MGLVASRQGMPKITSKYAMSRISANIEAMATEYGEEALLTLVKCMRDDDAPWAARTKAASDILDRAYGRSVDRVMLQTLGGTATDQPQTLSTQQLIAALSSTIEHKALEAAEGNPVLDAIEHEAETTPGSDLK